jgi:hypothetical protein
MKEKYDLSFLEEETPIVTTPFLLDLLDSALIENIQAGNIQTAFSVLDLSVNIAETLEAKALSPDEGQEILASVRKAMANGNIATAKQHMVEYALG